MREEAFKKSWEKWRAGVVAVFLFVLVTGAIALFALMLTGLLLVPIFLIVELFITHEAAVALEDRYLTVALCGPAAVVFIFAYPFCVVEMLEDRVLLPKK